MNDLINVLAILAETLAVAGFLLVLFDAFMRSRKKKKGETLSNRNRYWIVAIAVYLAIRVVLPDIIVVIRKF